ncbi:MAG: methylated-DNA--[protein]-cysteine S-methyltransferase [Phycisphaerae bacterium]|nr:methylated-DNA--[protein]-cysteine S-methyltransferase [Phycisphaerae bacterium]
MLYYTVFRTQWGYFAFAGADDAVRRTFLPVADRQAAERGLRWGLGPAAHDVRFRQGYLADLQEQIVAYFEGQTVDFSVDPPVELDHATPFGQKVLAACRTIPLGCKMTYSDLARQVGCPAAARAVGGVMAANPIPLIVPCHRVLRTDGGLGGFSAPGGTAIKQRLLEHEQAIRLRHPEGRLARPLFL